MAIFSPTANPEMLVTGTLVEPAGIVITGPSGRGCHSVVLLLAAVPDASDLARLRVGAGVDGNRIADRHATRCPDVEGGIARTRGDGQPGVREAEHVKAARRELRPRRNFHRRENCLLGWVFGEGPVGDVGRYWIQRCKAR